MSSIALGSAGYVYIMTSSTLSQAGLCKLGATTGDPDERARQLSASTSSPTPFYVAYSRAVPDVNEGERAMHALFDDRRVNDGREYFRVSVYEACIALDRIAGGASEMAFDPPTPFAELFAQFPDDGSARTLTPDERQQCRKLAGKLAAKREWRDAA